MRSRTLSKNLLNTALSIATIGSIIATANTRRRNKVMDQSSLNDLDRPDDLPSLKEFTSLHAQALINGKSMKFMQTTDLKTIQASEKIARANPNLKTNIFATQSQKSNEKGSKEIKISNIASHPNIQEAYENLTPLQKKAIISVGGPSAEDQILLTSLIKEISEKINSAVFVVNDRTKSNLFYSAHQLHARHGNALNADEDLSGHALLPKILKRLILGTSIAETLKPDFIKVDIDMESLTSEKLGIFFGNELNWMKQEFLKQKGQLTQHDVSRIESTLSMKILKTIESHTGKKYTSDNSRKPSSIHIVFSGKEFEKLKREHEDLDKIGIKYEPLSNEEKKQIFGTKSDFFSGYKYPADSMIRFDAFKINRELACQNPKINWLEGQSVTMVVLTQENGEVIPAGVILENGDFIPGNKIHISAGYQAKFSYDLSPDPSLFVRAVNAIKDYFEIDQPLKTKTTTSTGVSVNAIFKITPELRRMIDEHDSTGEIAVTNSHWSMIAHDDKHAMIRITGGGNTGSESYNPAYLLNIIANTRRIFGDSLVGILSSYGRPRSVNAANITEFSQICKDFIISYGKGGTGNTKRHFEAAFALHLMGFKDEVKDFFNKNGAEKDLGDKINTLFQSFENSELFFDNTKTTEKRLTFSESIKQVQRNKSFNDWSNLSSQSTPPSKSPKEPNELSQLLQNNENTKRK